MANFGTFTNVKHPSMSISMVGPFLMKSGNSFGGIDFS